MHFKYTINIIKNVCTINTQHTTPQAKLLCVLQDSRVSQFYKHGFIVDRKLPSQYILKLATRFIKCFNHG